MDAIKALRSLRMTRHFTDQSISEDIVADLLEVARWTGSSRNVQPWQFIVIRDRYVMKALAQASPNVGHVAGASLVFAVVMDGAENGTSYDAGRVSERVMLAAHAFGLGTAVGFIQPPSESTARAILSVPMDQSVRAVISMGYPAPVDPNAPMRAGTGRRPLHELVHYDTYGKRPTYSS